MPQAILDSMNETGLGPAGSNATVTSISTALGPLISVANWAGYSYDGGATVHSIYEVFVVHGHEWGWRQLGNVVSINSLTQFASESAIADPFRSRYLLSFIATYPSGERARVIAEVDSTDSVRWRETMPAGAAIDGLIPIDSARYFMIADQQIVFRSAGNVISTTPFQYDTGKIRPTYMLLRNRHVLRLQKLDSQDACVLQVSTAAGTLLARRVFPIAAGPPPSIALDSRRGDILLLMGGREGVEVTMLDESLNILSAPSTDAPIDRLHASRSRDSVGRVSGAVVDDVLWLAWEDFRNGVADIYGNRWSISTGQIASASEEPKSDRSSSLDLTVTGGGAGNIVIDLRSGTGGYVSLDIVDQVGRIVDRRQIDLHGLNAYVSIPVGDFPSGVYGVIARSTESAACARVVVVH
jgi:hypothetical protein